MSILVLETSAIISILIGESTAGDLYTEIESAEHVFCPANCVVEAIVVLVRKEKTGVEVARSQVLNLLQSMDVKIAALDEAAMHHALEGYAKFGQGTGRTPAVLNFGDCLSYGVAKAASGKLLYTGGDFGATDLG